MNNIKLITIKDNIYPDKLKELYDAPLCLFYNGNIELLHNKMVAIVGSRECSKYGKMLAFKFAFELSKMGITIISGGARGIDTYAHLGALKARKRNYCSKRK